MTSDIFKELFELGLKPIPMVWDEATKQAKSHTLAHGTITSDNKDSYNEETFKSLVSDLSKINGVALKLFAPFGMIDFDLKNTQDKEIFNRWKLSIDSQNENILSKVCYETTRSGGFHVYIKYPKLQSKISLAKEVKGEEVIALYTGGVLSYCDPTPGYNMIWNAFEDLEDLTDDEFSILVSTSETFNKYQRNNIIYESFENKNASGKKGIVNGRVLVNYPTEYENTCLQFDLNITDEVFESILNDMSLYEVKGYTYHKKDNYTAYLREGSKAKFSAKVYHKSKRVLLFTSSLSLYPSYMDRVNEDDHNWVLTPSRIIYYKNDRDWLKTIEEINLICDSADIELIKQPPVTNISIIEADRLKFPDDVFPETVQRFLSAQRIQYEYLAGGMLATLSMCIGNSSTLLASDGYEVKAILYLAIVAPPGASKTPALKTVFSPLISHDNKLFEVYEEQYKKYKKELAAFKNSVKKDASIEEPEEPQLKQVMIHDATIEKLIGILSVNTDGCGLFADELAGFLKRMNQYSSGGDEIQKWLELWSGGGITVQRISRKTDKVTNPFCTIIGGIQPGVLQSLSSEENEHNGFYHRFLFVYPDVMQKLNWEYHSVDPDLINRYHQFIKDLLTRRQQKIQYRLSPEANQLYKEWFDNKNLKYNVSDSDNHKGIIAKYQDYCLRFSLIIQCSYDCDEMGYGNIISANNMERAIRLTEYFFGSMNKSIKILAPQTPKDKLTGKQKELFDQLPYTFTFITASVIGVKVGIKKETIRVYLHRWSNTKDAILKKEGEQKDAVYTKIF